MERLLVRVGPALPPTIGGGFLVGSDRRRHRARWRCGQLDDGPQLGGRGGVERGESDGTVRPGERAVPIGEESPPQPCSAPLGNAAASLPSMRIGIIGAGGVGGYVGGLLMRSGADVTFLVRGDTLEALNYHGLTVSDADGSFTLPLVLASDSAQAIGPVDVLVHATKAHGFSEALDAALPMIGPDTLVVTVQNGVDAPALAASVVGAERVVPCVVRMFTHAENPGVVVNDGPPGTATMQPPDGPGRASFDAFVDALRAAGIRVDLTDDIQTDLWRKAMFVIPVGAIGGTTGDSVGFVRERLRDTMRAGMREVEAVGAARGVKLPPDAVDRILALVDVLPHELVTSMQRDLQEGRASELDAQVGAICRLGDAAGVPTPLLDLMFRTLSDRD